MKYRLLMYNADTTPKAPRMCKYINTLSWQRMRNATEANKGCIQYTHETFLVALFLTDK